MDVKQKALEEHEKWQGKIEVISRARLETPEDLSIAYTPGVAEPCLKISEDVDLSYKYLSLIHISFPWYRESRKKSNRFF